MAYGPIGANCMYCPGYGMDSHDTINHIGAFHSIEDDSPVLLIHGIKIKFDDEGSVKKILMPKYDEKTCIELSNGMYRQLRDRIFHQLEPTKQKNKKRK